MMARISANDLPGIYAQEFPVSKWKIDFVAYRTYYSSQMVYLQGQNDRMGHSFHAVQRESRQEFQTGLNSSSPNSERQRVHNSR